MVFYENEYYQNKQAQISTEAFEYPKKCCFLGRTDIV